MTGKTVKRVRAADRAGWRRWLARNYAREPGGVWLVFQRQHSGQSALGYEEAVEEAICYGWIDSIIKKIDARSYCRKFTPRKDGSNWSKLNRRRAGKAIREGRMTPYGLAKIEAAKRDGSWERDGRVSVSLEVPEELSAALRSNRKAREYFDALAPGYRKQFIGWIASAKRPATRARRAAESVTLLARGEKLGLK